MVVMGDNGLLRVFSFTRLIRGSGHLPPDMPRDSFFVQNTVSLSSGRMSNTLLPLHLNLPPANS